MELFDLRQWPQFKQAGGNTAEPAPIDQIAIDSRRIDSGYSLFVALKGNNTDGHRFVEEAAKVGAKYALVEKGWNAPEFPGLTLLKTESPLTAFQEIAKAYRATLRAKIIAIIGSFGKTMVKDLLETLIGTQYKVGASPESFNSQIGVPLSLLSLKKEQEFALIEAAISKEGEMERLTDMIAPDSTLLTHIGNKHLTTLGSLASIAAEMGKMLAATNEKGWVLLPRNRLLTPHLKEIGAKIHYWDDKKPPYAFRLSDEEGNAIPYEISFPDGFRFREQMTMGFSYFLDLLNMCVKSASLCGITSQNISQALKNYLPEPMRAEIWKSPVGTTFINDLYCSDPQSVDLSLKYFDQAEKQQRKIFVFGGMRSTNPHTGLEYRRIGKAIQRANVDQVVLFGERPFQPLVDHLAKHCPQTALSQCKNLGEALDTLKTDLGREDLVLLKGTKKIPIDTLTQAFNESICTNQCLINLEAIHSNIRTLQKALPHNPRLMVMVKALAYGTDDIQMAKFLQSCGVGILGVSYVDEGVSLKRAGVQQDIFVINAAKYEVPKVVKWDLELGLSEKEMIYALNIEAARQNKVIKVHLHIDTGMGRFGTRPENALELADLIRSSPHLKLEGIMTHFASADDPKSDRFTRMQIKRFDQTIETLHMAGHEIPYRHAANSSASIRFKLPQYNMIRIGVAVYGLFASEAAKKLLKLKPALSLLSRVVGINTLNKGETLSYGRRFVATRNNQRIAVLPIGYFDGLHLNYSGKGHVLVRGKQAPMVGKICMDFMMVDITDIPNAQIGDPVLIFGEDEYGHYLPPEDLALKGESIIHELITCLGPRIQRIFTI